MKTKPYFIKLPGESQECCLRDLSKTEVELIQGIFIECGSKYDFGKIVEIPDKTTILNYITAEKLDSYDFKDIQKICEHFNIPVNVFEVIRFEYSLTHLLLSKLSENNKS